MASVEKLSSKSDRIRQFFRKLYSFLPGSSNKVNQSNEANKLVKVLSKEGESKDHLFPSQKNLDVIMDTLRKDLVGMLRNSKGCKSVTLILYKLNTLDNNIREACRFQHMWIKQPSTGRESLKEQEKCIIRLIEEIMDDIYEAYRTSKKKKLSINDRSINGVISVLGILKKEVCNMINVIISSYEAQHNKSQSLKQIPSNNNKQITTISNPPNSPILENAEENFQRSISHNPSAVSASKSYPTFVKLKSPSFSSLHSINETNTLEPLEESTRSESVHRLNLQKSYGRINVCSKNSERNANVDYLISGCGDFKKRPNMVDSYYAYDNRPKPFFPPPQKYDRDEDSQYVDAPSSNQCEQLGSKLPAEKSCLSWPSGTNVRDIKSENFVDCYSRIESRVPVDCSSRLGQFNNSLNDNITDDFFTSDSDSDDSYVSCELNEFDLGSDFFNHVKEQFIQKPLEKLIHNNRYSVRDQTNLYSYKSAKLSESFNKAPKKPKTAMKPEAYHSVESIRTINFYVEEDLGSKLMDICKSVAVFDAANGTEELEDITITTHEKFPGSFKTLALSQEDYTKKDNLKTISSASLSSINSEPMSTFYNDNPNDGITSSSIHYHSIDGKKVGTDFGPNIGDSQYSNLCLRSARSKPLIPSCLIGEGNLLAMESTDST